MICPNCGTLVKSDNLVNNDWNEGRYYDYVTGECNKCHKYWQWTEVFNYSHDEDIEEITED
jgi:hypothetical protein